MGGGRRLQVHMPVRVYVGVGGLSLEGSYCPGGGGAQSPELALCVYMCAQRACAPPESVAA